MTTTRQLLIAARALIAEPGRWCQGIDRVMGARCAAAALEDAGDGQPRNIRTLAYDTFKTTTGISGKLSDWNDAPNRTHAEVLAAFDRAIEGAE